MGRSGPFLRYSAVFAAVIAAFVALAAASASAAPTAYVANAKDNTVSAVNTATNAVVGKPITVGTDPFSIAITPDGRFAYVVNRMANSVSVIETATNRLVGKPILVGEDPIQIAIAPNGLTAWVADEGSNEISIINTTTDLVVRSISTKGFAWGVSFTPDGKIAYVPLYNEGAVEVIETSTGDPLGQIPVGEHPFNVTFTPNGETAYVVNNGGNSVTVISTATRQPIRTIPVGKEPWGFALTPDGQKAYVANGGDGTVSVIDTATNATVGEPIGVGETPAEIAITPNGRTAYVTDYGSNEVAVINTTTNAAVNPVTAFEGDGPHGIAVSPDQSPTAVFTPPSATVGVAAPFNGSASTDPDGTIASYVWNFEDGRGATGVTAVHAFATAGTFNTKLTVTDEEGCSAAMVFTGRTAYCSGGESTVSHPVIVKAVPVAETQAPVCKSNFGVGGISHNRKNGTAKLRVNVHAAGSIFLFGKKVHAVSRKAKAAGSMTLTIHARVELNKRLKKVHRAPVAVRITFTPSDGCGYKTVHRSFPLLRAAKKQHRH